MIKSPVCGEYEFKRDFGLDVCDICGWENDGVQLNNPATIQAEQINYP
jgi:hypothetical protein